MMTRMVRITVASHDQSSVPDSSSAMTDARDDAPMFTRLLPMRMADSARSKLLTMAYAALARLEPSSIAFSSRMWLEEE